MLDFIIYIAVAAVAVGLLFLIINGTISTYNLKRRAFINLGIGLGLFIIFMTAWIIDFVLYKQYKTMIIYLMIPVVILLMTIGIFAYFYITGKHHNLRQRPFQRARQVRVKVTDVPTSRPQQTIKPIVSDNSFVYLIFKFNDMCILKKDGPIPTGYISQIRTSLPKDTVSAILKHYELKTETIDFVGKITNNNKTFYSYLITLNNYQNQLPKAVEISQYSIYEDLPNGLDKEIILRTLLKEQFTIKRDNINGGIS